MFWFRAGICALLSFSLTLSPIAWAVDCSAYFEPVNFNDAVEALISGGKAYGTPEFAFTLDRQTERDLNVAEVAAIYKPYLYTELGLKRIEALLRFSKLNPVEISSTQAVIQYIADHSEEFNELRARLKQLGDLDSQFLKNFSELTEESSNIIWEQFWAVFTIVGLLTPTLTHLFGHINQLAESLMLGQAYVAGAANSVKRARPRRILLEPYRQRMLSVRQALKSTKDTSVEGLNEIHQALNVVHAGERPNWGVQIFGHINQYFNPQDSDLVLRKGSESEEPSPANVIYRRLLWMQSAWTKKIFGLDVPFFDVSYKWDMLHISNFQLRHLRGQIVKNKNVLASIFSALATLEAYIAVADMYNVERARQPMALVKPAAPGAAPHVYFEHALDPVLAIESSGNAVANDVVLGRPPEHEALGNNLTALVANPGEGVRTAMRTVGRLLLMAQAGFPVFAKGGSYTPSVIISAIEPGVGGPHFSQTRTDARRINSIRQLLALHPYLVVLWNEPFAGAGELRSLALKLVLSRRLIESSAMGMIASKTRRLFSLMRDWKDIALYQLEDHQLKPIESAEAKNAIDPETTFSIYEEEKVDNEFVEDTRKTLAYLEKVIPEDLPLDQNDIRVPQGYVPDETAILNQLQSAHPAPAKAEAKPSSWGRWLGRMTAKFWPDPST